MKKLKYILLLCGFAASFSCNKSFLEEHPKSFLTAQGFYKNLDDLQMGLNAAYRAPQDRYSNMWAAPSWFLWATDIGEITPANAWPNHNQLARLRSDFNSSSDIPWEFWDYIYRHVKDINSLLEAIPTVTAEEKIKEEIEGQARALRAFLYFDGVRIYGGIPLVLESVKDITELNNTVRNTPEEVYDQIIADLQFGIENLPNQWTETDDLGRITSGACAAMLARVYITMAGYPLHKTEKWQDASKVLKEFIEDKKYGSQYALFDHYADAFADANIPGKESVWTVNFTRGTFGQGSQIHVEFSPIELYYDSRCGLERGGGWSNTLPTDSFLNSYDKANDTRFKFTYWSSTADIPSEYADINSSSTGPIVFAKPNIKKFREKTPNDNSQGSGIDHYVIRYADVLLMYSEVLNELGDNNCYKYINIVRHRAGLADLPQMSQQQFRDHMLLERGWELGFEGERRFDLMRTGTYYDRVKAWNPQAAPNIKKDKHELWPLPQREIDIDKSLTQNPGY